MKPVSLVLADWKRDFPPGVARRTIVRAYFAVALASRQHAYLLLRIARRLAMRLLPADYFPRGGQYHTARVDITVMAILTQGILAA